MKRSLSSGPARIGLLADDDPAAVWLCEFLAPWFAPSADDAIEVLLSSSADDYARFVLDRPSDAVGRRCFRLDREIVSLPAWPEAEGVAVADGERSCGFVVAPDRIALFGEPTTRRWRFTLQWIFHEIAATALRRSAVDLHAAAVEVDGEAVVFIGPKGAGKTTLSFHCLRSGRCRWIANDRAFAIPGEGAPTIRGMPNVVKIAPATAAAFPELTRGLRALERPYLHTVVEALDSRAAARGIESGFALSPPQLAHQLGVEAVAAAPIGALVFPEIREDVAGIAVEPVDAIEAAETIWRNLYGKCSASAGATLFDEIGGGETVADRAAVDALARAAPRRRVRLGRHAYDDPERVTRLLDELRT